MKTINRLITLTAALALSAGTQLQAASVTFNNPGATGSNWNVPNSWNPNLVPDATTDVNIVNGFCYIQLGDENLSCNSVNIGGGTTKASLIFNAPSKLTVTSGTITNGSGPDDSAILIQSTPVTINAKSINTDAFIVGQGEWNGAYTIPAGQAWTAPWVFIGNGGGANTTIGTLTLDGGSLATNNLSLSLGASTTAGFTLTSGTLAAQNILRKMGNATFTWNDGTIQTLPDQHTAFYGTAADKPLNIQLAGSGNHVLAPGAGKIITEKATAAFVDQAGQKGTLTIEGPGTVSVESTANTYTGKTTLKTGTVLIGATGALGKGDLEVAAGAILSLGNNAAIAPTANVAMQGTNSAMSLNYSSGTLKIGSLSLNGTPVKPGTYTAAQLGSTYGGTWFSRSTGMGTLTVAAEAKP